MHWLVILAGMRRWNALRGILNHLVFYKSDTISKHFVCYLLVEVDVYFLDRPHLPSLLIRIHIELVDFVFLLIDQSLRSILVVIDTCLNLVRHILVVLPNLKIFPLIVVV